VTVAVQQRVVGADGDANEGYDEAFLLTHWLWQASVTTTKTTTATGGGVVAVGGGEPREAEGTAVGGASSKQGGAVGASRTE
jgi:hypothetical protein